MRSWPRAVVAVCLLGACAEPSSDAERETDLVEPGLLTESEAPAVCNACTMYIPDEVRGTLPTFEAVAQVLEEAPRERVIVWQSRPTAATGETRMTVLHVVDEVAADSEVVEHCAFEIPCGGNPPPNGASRRVAVSTTVDVPSLGLSAVIWHHAYAEGGRAEAIRLGDGADPVRPSVRWRWQDGRGAALRDDALRSRMDVAAAEGEAWSWDHPLEGTVAAPRITLRLLPPTGDTRKPIALAAWTAAGL